MNRKLDEISLLIARRERAKKYPRPRWADHCLHGIEQRVSARQDASLVRETKKAGTAA